MFWSIVKRFLLVGTLGLLADCQTDAISADVLDAGLHDAVLSSDDSFSAECAPGFEPHGPACAPIFDTCPDDELPVLGGTCKKIGVKRCPGGIMGPPDWHCNPIGPHVACPPGWHPGQGNKDDNPGCEPILPEAACPAGQMEVIGKTTCQPVGVCGTEPYPEHSGPDPVLYVNQSYSGGASDGSLEHPFITIQAALNSATPNTFVAIAAGSYAEDLILAQPVTLAGRCAELVTIVGQSSATKSAAITVTQPAVLRDLRVTGPKYGVFVEQKEAVLERLVVAQCGQAGVLAADGTELDLRDSLLEKNILLALGLSGARALLERVVIRETQHDSSSTAADGMGIVLAHDLKPAVLEMRDSVLRDNLTTGIAVYGSQLLLERTLIKNTRAHTVSSGFGQGVGAFPDDNGRTSSLELKQCVIANNQAAGVWLEGSAATIEDTVIRDTIPRSTDKKSGYGIEAHPEAEASLLTLRRSLLSRNAMAGILLIGSDLSAESSIIRETQPQLSDQNYGVGLYAEAAVGFVPHLQLTEVIVEKNHTYGLGISGGEATLERSIITTMYPNKATDGMGIGLGVMKNADKTPVARLTLQDCLVSQNQMISIDNQDAELVLVRTIVRDTQPQSKNGQYGVGVRGWGKTNPATVSLTECIISHNHAIGYINYNTNGTLHNTLIQDTHAQLADDQFGIGVQAVHDQHLTELSIQESVIEGARQTGLIIRAMPVIMQRSVVRQTLGNSGGLYGDGIEVWVGAELHLEDSLVDESTRAGLLFIEGSGSVQRSVFRRGLLAIDLEKGATPHIADDNVYMENQENRVTFGLNLQPSPFPALPSQ